MIPLGRDTNASFLLENNDTNAVENNDLGDLGQPDASTSHATFEPTAEDDPVENDDNGTNVEYDQAPGGNGDSTPDLDFNNGDFFDQGELKHF